MRTCVSSFKCGPCRARSGRARARPRDVQGAAHALGGVRRQEGKPAAIWLQAAPAVRRVRFVRGRASAPRASYKATRPEIEGDCEGAHALAIPRRRRRAADRLRELRDLASWLGWVARVGLAEPRSEADTASRISQMRGPVQAGPLRYERVELPIRALVRRMELWQDERNEDGLLTRDVDLTVVLEVVAECVSAGREREETAVQHRGHRSSIH